jgi:hypothetical protein
MCAGIDEIDVVKVAIPDAICEKIGSRPILSELKVFFALAYPEHPLLLLKA